MDLGTILKDSKLLRKNPLGIKPKLSPIIEEVRLPSELKKAQNLSVKLKKSSPELQLRLQYLQEFLSSFDESKNTDDFLREFPSFLEEFKALVSDQTLKDAYDTNQDPEHNDEDDFVHKARIQAAVLRKSPRYLSVISLDGCDEFLLEVGRKLEGLGIQVRTGDVISIVSPKSKQSVDPELVWCYKVYSHEAEEFLDKLKSVDNACKLLEDFVRSVAVWKYILNGFEEEDDNQGQICKKILEVCQQVSDIASASLMTGTIRNFWTSFKDSKFFNDVLPKLVQDEAWRRENVQLVKQFLENLLKHRPECSVLALKIVEHILTIQDTGMEFTKNLLSILALNVSGVKDNPKHLKWNQRSVIPVASELLTTATPWKDLPHVKVADDKKKGSLTDCVYKSEEEYIKTYYTLMREECFHKLKNGINHFLMTGKFNPKDIMMYRVHLVKAVPNINKSIQDSGLALLFEFPNKKNEESDDPDNSNWLMGGNLLCLSFDGTFKCPVWGIISAEPQKTKEKTQIQVSLCSERNKLSEADVITKLQQLKDQGFPAYMVESNTYYPAFGPPLEVLQQKETVPLKEQLVQVQKCTDQPPEYLKNLKKCPDWSIVFENPGCIELQDDVDNSYRLLVQEFKALRENKESKPKLDEKQLDAVEQALHNKVTLIQGPPGTGKSYVGEALLHLLLSMEVPKNNGPILVATYKNHALDNFLHTCAKKIPDFLENLVRVGRGNDDTPEELKERRVFEIIKNTDKDDYYDTLKRLKLELEAMKPGIEKCVKSLHSSRNKFTVSIFIKEAEEKHFQFLSKERQYDERIKVILNDKYFRDKHFKELSKMIEEPLKEWLPSQGEFDRFAGRVTQEGFQSCIDVQQESSGNQDDSKDEPSNTRQFMPSEERQERQADFNEEQDGNESADDETFHSLEEKHLIVLPEIPDEKLGNVRAILNAGDIQQLKDYEKIQMVYALQQQRYKTVKQELLGLTQDFIEKQQRRKEVSDQREIKILQQQSVIGMTVSGAAIRAKWLESIKPSVLIVEEAAEILESQLVSVIPSSVQHLIMIGDHQQLRPQVHYEVLCRKCNFHISMFERLIRGGLEYAQLNKQGRMSDDIAELVRKLGIYDEYQTRKEVVERNKVPGCLSKSMFFYDHTKEEKAQRRSHSMYNEEEADVVVQVAKYLVGENSEKPESITVLCSYRGQVQYLKKKLKNQDAYNYQLSDIVVTTIDSFQGKENDIVLLSLVRSSKLSSNAKIGYLSSINRICVAVSRARTGLYLFGNTQLLKKKSSRGWGKIIEHMAEKGLVGRFIESLIGIQGAASVDGSSPCHAGAQPRRQSEKHLCNQGPTFNIQFEANTVIIGDNNKATINNICQDPGVADSHQVVGRPLQQSTPTRPPQDDQPSQESKQKQESQPVKETSKYNISSSPAPELQHNSLFEERRDVEEMSWIENQPSAEVTGTRPSLPSAEESEAQEMSWTGEDSQSSVVLDSRLSLPSAEESEAQEMSWTDQDPHTPVVTDSRPSLPSADDSDQTQELSLTGDPLPSATETDGRPSFPLEESGVLGASDVESQPSTTEADRRLSQETGNGSRPVQDTYLPKQQQKQEEKEEDDKVQPVEEMSEDKGQLAVGTQSDLPSMSDDVKASGEDVSSPQQDFPICGSPADEKREQKIFDDEEACILRKPLREAPNSANLVKELQHLQSLGAINPDNQELTINDLKEKLGPEGQEILKKYLDDQGCNCDNCGGLR